MLMGSVSMSMMNISAKFVSKETQINFLQMGAFRGLCMALGCFIHAKCRGINVFEIPEGFRVQVVLRGLAGVGSSLG